MFQNARLKLTAWYLLILMSISIIFSIIIYRQTTAEVDRSLRTQEYRIYRETHPFSFISPDQIELDPQTLSEAQDRIRLLLVFVNLGILGIAGGAGYFLAGLTLRPIQAMVDEQNRFITDSSHELRTPLTSLRSEIEVGLRNKTISLSEAKTLLASNLEEVIALQDLSNNLLELAQNGTLVGKQVMQKVSLQDSIVIAIKKVEPLARKKKITIVPKIKDIAVMGIEDRLIEVFIILLDNAIKYSNTHASVTVRVSIQKDMVGIDIIDTGMGIAKEDIPHIFDRFYRANKSRSKNDVPGYGLGLSIAKKIIETHNGKIIVQSTLEKGTIFTITLPKV